MKPTELKPCPFCGSSDIAVSEGENGGACVWCMNCFANATWKMTREGAVAAWNLRADGENRKDYKMKPIDELGISPAPWNAVFGKYSAWVEGAKNALPIVDIINMTTVPRILQARANARLISAAPELYEALREAVAELCKVCIEYEDMLCGDCREVVGKAKAALEKAGGAA